MTRFAQDLLLDMARVVSEGAVDRRAQEEDSQYQGSTLISFDLNDPRIAAMDTEVAREDLCRALERSVSMHIKLMRMARLEAERRCAPLLPREMRTELSFTIDDDSLLVDIDVECPLAEPEPEGDILSEEGF